MDMTASRGADAVARTAARRLSAQDWAVAALEALASGGLAAVAVERLAERLGATKGSFYWHFANRDALVRAALEQWEQQHTAALIARAEEEADPAEQLRALFLAVFRDGGAGRVELALLAHVDDPVVGAAVARVTERRTAYVAELYRRLGWRPDRARRRAVLAVSVHLGHLQLVRAAPGTLPDEGDGWTQHLADVLALLTAGDDGSPG